MIIYPKNWSYIYTQPTLEDIEDILYKAIEKTDCPNLCLSGGVDSSLTLYFMSKLFSNIKCFTIGLNDNHPDVIFASQIAKEFHVTHLIYKPTNDEVKRETSNSDLDGDVNVRLLFKFISQFCDSVIVTDCIDELDCGYYDHQKNPDDKTFRYFINQLQDYHLKPLNKNSGDIKTYVPYSSEEVVNMFLRIPVADKAPQRKPHIRAIASKYLPEEIVNRWKYGFCDAMRIKE